MAAQFAVVDAFLYGLPDVRPRDREVYLGLAFLANRETGMFFARVDEIAQWLGVGRSTAQKRISRLIELGLLQRRLMWLDPDNPQGRPQYKRVIANGQRASDFRLLRQADGFPDDVFTRSLNEASQSSEAPHSDATSTEFRESAQGLTSEPTQGLTSEPTQGLRTEAHNRELSTKNSQQRTKPPASPLRAAGPTTAEPDDLDRARRGERTTTAMTLPPDFRGNPATRAEAAELGLDHDAAVRALRTAEGGDTARNWGGTLVNYMRTISGHTDDLQHTHRWQDADELYAEAFDELYGDGSSGGSLTEGSGSTCSPVDPPATQQVPPATQQDFPCETAGPPPDAEI
ncbi:MAG: helix-turn-helix domain-containing protein [Gordonia paraffinivorans]